MADNFRYPDPSMPVIFSDGIESMSHGSEVVKFYLGRFDSEIGATGPSKLATACQVVMPITAFVAAALFMEERVERLIADGKVSRADVEAARASQLEAIKNAQKRG